MHRCLSSFYVHEDEVSFEGDLNGLNRNVLYFFMMVHALFGSKLGTIVIASKQLPLDHWGWALEVDKA